MATVVLDIETIAAEIDEADRPLIAAAAAKRGQDVYSFGALCPALARVVAVGMVNPQTGQARAFWDGQALRPDYYRRGDDNVLYSNPPDDNWTEADCNGERSLLIEVHQVLAHYSTLVTFNGRGFDLPVLIHRAKLHGITPAPIVLACAFQKPWESRPHIDMLSELTIGGAAGRYSLAVYCAAFGIPSPKAEGDGAGVRGLVECGDSDRLCRYVLGDVTATAELARRWGAI